jgi:hypothetical protein
MITMPVLFYNTDCYGKSLLPEARQITGATRDECFVDFFKKNNRYKYCNGTYYEFVDPVDSDEYHNKWFTLKNYALNGGDMD